jgi:adenylylsulfate kinase-like enzyme
MTPVLWLYGPGGVGKTAIGYEVFRQLSREGVPVGYADNDQLVMCQPGPQDDPGRFGLRHRQVDAITRGLRAAGARCVVIAGYADHRRGVQAHLLPHAGLVACRLRAGAADLERRVLARGRPGEPMELMRKDADEIDGFAPPGVVADTTGLDIAQSAALVRKQIGDWPGPAGDPGPQPPSAPARILWICGVTASGKSAVAYQLYRAIPNAAFSDLDQLGFLRPIPADDPLNHRVKARNLAAVWGGHHACGSERLVICGPVTCSGDVRTYLEAFPKGTTISLVRLDASAGSIAERIAVRRDGGPPWGLAGDQLLGGPAAHCDEVSARAAAEARALRERGVGDFGVGTDGRSVAAVAEEILDWFSRRTG